VYGQLKIAGLPIGFDVSNCSVDRGRLSSAMLQLDITLSAFDYASLQQLLSVHRPTLRISSYSCRNSLAY